ALYDTVVARYSSLATAALGRMLLPYMFPELSAFATVEDLVSHLRASDARYRAAAPAEFLDRNQPPMFITLYFIVTRLPDSLRSVRDHFLSLEPTVLTVDLLEKHLLAAQTIVVTGHSPSPLCPSSASVVAVDVTGAEDVGAASASAKRHSSKGNGGRGGGGGSGGGGGGSGGGGSGGSGGGSGSFGGGSGGSGGSGGGGSGGSGGGRTGAQRGGSGGGQRQQQQRRSETPSPQQLCEGLFQRGASEGSGSCLYVIRTGDRADQTCGKPHTQHRCFSRLNDAWRAEFGDEAERPLWAELLRSGVAIFDLDYDSILSAMYALSVSAEGTSESSLLGTAPAEALHTFTLDSGASRCFFRDSTTLTPLSAPVPVILADPSRGPVVARFSTVLPCPAVPSDSLSGLQLPSFSTNLVSTAALQDSMVTTTTLGGQRVSISTCQVAPPCSCRLLSHQTLLWHHRLGHPSLPCLCVMHSNLLVSSLPRSLPPLPTSPALPCLPCVEGRQRAAPHSSSFPPTIAPLQNLHMDVWGPARVSGQGRERYFLLVVDDYKRYTTVFPLRSKGQVVDVLIPSIRTVRLQLRKQFHQDLPDLCLHSDRGVMEVARTSMIHAAAPHFLWSFAVRYAAHQLNLWPHVSLPETSPTLRWTWKVGDASVFWVWGCRAFVRDTSADKLSARAIPCVFLGFPPGWQFYHPTSRRVFPSQNVTFDESVPFYHLFPYCFAPPPPPSLFHAPGPPPVDALPPEGPAPSGVSQVDPLPGTVPVEVPGNSGVASWGAEPRGAGPGGAESQGAGSRGAEPGGDEPEGVEPGGAETAGVESGGAKPEGVEPGGAESEGAESGGAEPRGTASAGGLASASPRLSPRPEPLSPQQLREWFVQRTHLRGGAAGGGDHVAGDTRAGGARVTAGAGGTGGAAAAGFGGARTRETGGAGTGGVGGAGAGDPTEPGAAESGGTRARGPRAGGAGAGGAGAGGTTAGGAVAGGAGAVHPGVGGAGAGGIGARGTVRLRPDPSFESTAASALVAELVDFAANYRLDYATALVAESASASPPSVGGECALGTDVFEDRHEDLQCLATALPRFASMLLAREGDSDAPDIPTLRSYADAVTDPYSSQWQTAMDAKMASWKSTGTYIDVVPPSGVNIVDSMWIFRVKRPLGSPPAFKARYVARGFSQRQGVEYFQTFSPTPKMTTLLVLLHVAAQRDDELHSLDFSTAFLQGSLHAEIWLRRPPGFTGSFPAGTMWSLRRPVYSLRQAPREWHDTPRTTLAALGFTPCSADLSMFLRTDTSLPPIYILVYIDDLVFATADTEALTLVKSELQKRHTCTDLGELRSYLGL
ncbi:unnamed protein product, partial [Closterium sp. NIES-54]